MNKKELRKLSKRELIDIIFQLKERQDKIEKYLKAFDNPHTPSSKQNKNNTKKEVMAAGLNFLKLMMLLNIIWMLYALTKFRSERSKEVFL